MGMYDSFYTKKFKEFQTKQFDCNLDSWHPGDHCDHVKQVGHDAVLEEDYDKGKMSKKTQQWHAPKCYLHFIDGVWTGYKTKKMKLPKKLRKISGFDLLKLRSVQLRQQRNKVLSILVNLHYYTADEIAKYEDFDKKSKRGKAMRNILDMHMPKDLNGKRYKSLDTAVNDIYARLWKDLDVEGENIYGDKKKAAKKGKKDDK